MTELKLQAAISRRRALKLAGLATAGLAAAGTGAALAGSGPVVGRPYWQSASPSPSASPTPSPIAVSNLPMSQIESVLQTKGSVTDNVFMIGQDRTDIGSITGPLGFPFLPPFALTNSFVFQALSNGMAIMNGDMTLKEEEVEDFIDALIKNNLVFQAFHQHYVGENPQVWHIHQRGMADPVTLAQAVANAVGVTSTPLPQGPPSNPSTPLPTDHLASILGGMATVKQDGVVEVLIPRANQMRLGGVDVSPFLNIMTHISFEPLSNGQAAASVDFGMIAPEITNVMAVMRQQKFFVGCLYNQETDEYPQLYWSHMARSGDAATLARQIKMGLNQMNLNFNYSSSSSS